MPPPVPPGGWSRRQLLLAGLLPAALVAGGATACGIDLGAVRLDDVPAPTPPEPGPDDLARMAAVRTATALRDDALAAAAARADLAPLLLRVAADHEAHLAQLGPLPADDAGAPTGPSAGSPSGGPSESATPMPTPRTTADPAPPTDSAAPAAPTAPADPAARIGGETAAATEALRDVGTTSGPLARLLVSVAASRAAHAAELSAALALPAPAPPLTTLGTSATLDSPATPSLAPTGTSEDAASALLALVDGEHAAAYAFGVLAVRLADEPRASAVRSIDRHRTAARRLAVLATAAGLLPRPAEVAYPVPPVPDAPAAGALAADLELGLAAAAAVLVATAEGDLRLLGADVVVARSLDALGWRPALPALPGLPEHGS